MCPGPSQREALHWAPGRERGEDGHKDQSVVPVFKLLMVL